MHSVFNVVWKLRLTIVVFATLMSGCSTSGAIQRAHGHYLNGDTVAALQELDNPTEVASRDRLLFWLEKGMYLHYAADYRASANLLLKAADYLNTSDYISLSEETKELIANEWAGHYRGEYSEQLWIHSVLMMNFLLLGNFESAAVEARRSLDVIASYPDVLNEDHFTKALIAISFEATRQINDAYIVNAGLADSLELPQFNQFVDYQASLLGFNTDTTVVRPSAQHAVIFISNGRIPSKRSGSLITGGVSRLSFPEYDVPYSSRVAPSALIDGQPCDCYEIHSDFGKLVAHSLNRRGATMAARGLIRAVAKEAVADAVADADKVAGELARLLLFALEEADTRSWRSLPRHFTLLRVPIDKGAKQLRISLNGSEHLISLDEDQRQQPLLFYTVHAGQSAW